MRIVIDFLHAQDGIAPAALTLVQSLARQCGPRELWIAAPLANANLLLELRLAFGQHVRAFDLTGNDHLQPALREQALASLVPDVVLVPGAAGKNTATLPFPLLQRDPQGLDAAALLAELDATAAERVVPPQSARPKLAYVSPLPPVKSGIADYSAELVPELAKYYDIELVVGQDSVNDARLEGFPLRSADWLRAHAHGFERVLYHVGNSHAHQHMFDLIREVPGIVVLHDFYFSGVLDNLEREGYLPQAFVKALYESHGYTGLLSHRKEGRNPSIWKYPLNKGVLDNAAGVIVHADFSKQLATEWYGPGAADGWQTIPLLRGRPEDSSTPRARAAARTRLGLDGDAFLVTTFGMLGRTKLNEELLDAFLASPLARDARCRLVFVGENDPGLYGAGLLRKIAASDAAGRIRIAGFVDAATYADYLAASDCAVQLRASTRGETSASVLDCLLYGIPTIVNAHGSTASISAELLLKLPDAFTTQELADALARLRGDAGLRAGLSQRALAHMASQHAPAHVGKLYFDAIEGYARRGPLAAYRKVVRAAAPQCPDAQMPALASAIAFNRKPTAPRQLLVDVSAVVQSDLKTGIQRVVRSILLAMIADPPPGYRIEPVYSHGANRSYQYARHFGLNMVGETTLALEDAPVDLRPGDIFFGLDLFTNGTSQNEDLLASMRDRGVGIYFVVFDILPMLRPDVFPFGTEQYFGDFLRTVHKVSDGVLCISRAVADELAAWIEGQGLSRRAPLKLGHFHLGADIDASAPSFGLPPDADHVLAALKQRPSFIMVGTVEPRKGHTQSLAAFELLWERGEDVNLVVVGKQGWMMEKLCERMAAHPEKSKRLFWLNGISDEMLLKLYAGSAALLSPSEGEGFGLPLIESAQHGIPIIARSLPVFREVAGEHAYYFDGLAPGDLADAVSNWLALQRDGRAPQSTGMPWLTWDEAAQQVLDGLVRQQWYRVLPGTAPTRGEGDAGAP
ncbi:glycosyltransferase [Massilia yuzhufengensis]|uniref:Glycosyltransferase involved in cell wall bisynthesis n=1 Tax=Massilia yuzhufengensis TaxID=1164594 RepID=A0A1I1VRF7_9BURK|nr:glycosyltransferase [Massilia yuzhufengensis]SFD85531.1 Glycosyltransferase involved in cell wall bisynthesis [Massilia yuzhufengensis]